MAYQHLTQEERYQIYAYRKAEFSIRCTALALKRSPSTVSDAETACRHLVLELK